MTEDYSEAKFWGHCLIATVGAVLINLYSVELAILFGWCYCLPVSIKRGSDITITKNWAIGTTTLLFGWLYFSTCISDGMAIYTLYFLAAWICLLGFPYASMKTLCKPSLWDGRFTRSQFWGYSICGQIAMTIITIPTMAILGSILAENNVTETDTGNIGAAVVFALSIPYCIFYLLPIAIKRAHDLGCTDRVPIAMAIAQVCLALVAFFEPNVASFLLFVLGIPYIIWLGFFDSQKGTNKYGPSSKYPDTAA